MDYRELLIKYMEHIGVQEGTYFTGHSLDYGTSLTPEEVIELRILADETDSRIRAGQL